MLPIISKGFSFLRKPRKSSVGNRHCRLKRVKNNFQDIQAYAIPAQFYLFNASCQTRCHIVSKTVGTFPQEGVSNQHTLLNNFSPFVTNNILNNSAQQTREDKNLTYLAVKSAGSNFHTQSTSFIIRFVSLNLFPQSIYPLSRVENSAEN